MNDNDIIKALKCQLGIDTSNNCFGCLYRENKSFINASECILEVVEDLINRQKAEIERLYKTLSAVQREQYINGRNDGIKEFEEKLKEKAFYVQEFEWDGYVVDCNDIIEFAEEMTGGWDEHH